MNLIFNTSNAVILIFVVAICYTFWAPYLRGRKYTNATIEGYEHPKEGKDKDLMWRYRISYKDKGGKRYTVCSKRELGSRQEILAEYKKGDKVDISVFTLTQDAEPLAFILSDGKDKKQTIIYTIGIFVGAFALSIGFIWLQSTYL